MMSGEQEKGSLLNHSAILPFCVHTFVQILSKIIYINHLFWAEYASGLCDLRALQGRSWALTHVSRFCTQLHQRRGKRGGYGRGF
jgi:hypothetical protein